MAFAQPTPAKTASQSPTPSSAAASAAAALDGSPGAPYTLDASVGYARYSSVLKAETWVPVWVFIQARQSDIDGQIILQQPRNMLQVTIPFQVAKGNLKRYLAHYRFESGQLPRLELNVRPSRMTGERITIPLRFAEPGEQHLLVLAEESGGFGMLARDPIDTSEEDESAPVSNLPQNRQAQLRRAVALPFGGTKVIYGDPELLPEDPVALESLDGIVISTPRVRAINARQWEALRNWVAGGGRLLLAAGRHQPFIAQSALKNPYGIKLSDPQPVATAELPGHDAATSATLLASWPEGEWTKVELGDAKHPLVVGKQSGLGWFHLCAAALDTPMLNLIKSQGEADRFWPALLERHTTASPMQGLAQAAEGAIGYDLQRPFGFNLVGAWWVLGFLGSYILVALPLTWIVCGRLRRREWAWPVAIVLALGFAGYGYASGLRSQSKVFQANELTVLTHTPGATAARAVTFSSVFSPRRWSADLLTPSGSYPNRIGMGAGAGHPGYNPYGEADLYSEIPLSLSFQPPLTKLAGFFFYPWSPRGLRCDFTAAAGVGVSFKPRENQIVQGGIPTRGRITNGTPWEFKRWWLTDGTLAWRADRLLKKGETIELDRANIAKNGTPLPEIVAYSLRTNILEPALAELDAENRRRSEQIGNPFWPEVQRLAWRPRSELFFIGEAEAALSPLTQQMPMERRRSVLLYEEALTAGSAADASRGADGFARRWDVGLVTARERLQGSVMWVNEKDGLGGEKAGMLFQPQSLDIQLVPDRPVTQGLGGAASFGFKIVSHPDENEPFVTEEDCQKYNIKQYLDTQIDPVTGMPLDPRMMSAQIDPATGLPVTATPTPKPQKEEKKPYPEYVVAGCLVKVFNFRRQAWEPTLMPAEAGHRVSPLRDYLNPGSSALLLRIEATAKDLRFRVKNGPGGGKLKNGVDMWGGELAKNPGFTPPISFLKIKDVRVSPEK